MIFFIALLNAIGHVCQTGNRVLVSLNALHLGANPFALGMLMATSSILPMLLAVHSGKIIDKFGTRLPLILGSTGNCLALLLPFLFQKLFVLYIAQTILGLSNLFFHIAIQNLVGSIGDEKARTRNFGTLSLGGSAGSLIGPLFVGFAIDHSGFSLTYLFVSLLVIIPGLVFLIIPALIPKTQQVKEKRKNEGKTAFDLFKILPLRRVFISSGVILTGTSLYTFYLPIYGYSIGLSASIIGIIISIYSSAFFVVRMIMPMLVNKFSHETVLTYCLFVGSIAYLFLPLFNQVIMLAIISFILGLGLGCGQPLSTILTYNRSPEGRTAEALGVRFMVNRFTTFSVPLLFGSVGSVFGLIPVFWSNTIMLAIGGYLSKKK